MHVLVGAGAGLVFVSRGEGGRESEIVCVQWTIVRCTVYCLLEEDFFCTVVGNLRRACECDVQMGSVGLLINSVINHPVCPFCPSLCSSLHELLYQKNPSRLAGLILWS